MSRPNDRNISVGDIAKLKSGGPKIVVTGISCDEWTMSNDNKSIVKHLNLAMATKYGLFQITVGVDAVIILPKKRARRGKR